MITATLSPAALGVLNSYLALPFKQGSVVCPYYNNDRTKLRAGLRVLIGKGSPADIMDEALIISLHDKINLDSMTPEVAKKFLVDHKIGVDCSALVYYTLAAEVKSRGLGKLHKLIRFPLIKNPFRKLLTNLRPAENVNVLTLAHEANSSPIAMNDCRPGDSIILKNTGPAHKLQHVLLVHATEKENDILKTIHYTHSFAWATEGRYGHGVRQGYIEITNPQGTLLEQVWRENGVMGAPNETFEHAKMAETLELRRLRVLA